MCTWSEKVPADPAYAPLTNLAKDLHRLYRRVLGWRPVNPPQPGMLVFARGSDECMVVVVAEDEYAAVVASPDGDEPPEPIAPVDEPSLAAARIARMLGAVRDTVPGATQKVAVTRVLDGTTCSYEGCTLLAVASVAMTWDWVDFRCLMHWPETHAGLTRRGHELVYYGANTRTEFG